MLADYFRIGLRNLARRRLRSWLTLLGIVIGITSVVALIGLGQGLEAAIAGQFGNFGTDLITISASGGFGPPGYGVTRPLTKDNLEEIRRVNGVDIAGARLIDAGSLEFNEKVAFGYAASMPTDEGRELLIEATDIKVSKGRLIRENEKGRILVGASIAGEDTAEYFGKPVTTGTVLTVGGADFEVAGILEKLGSFILDNVIIMNEDDFRDTFGVPDDEYDIIVARAISTGDIPVVRERIEKVLRRARGVKEGEEDFSVETRENALSQINSVLFAVQVFVYVIAGLSIVVGGFGIMNTMFTSVIERRREIGIMKSIGARNSTIFTLFLIESGFIGMVGGIVGAAIGVALAVTLAKIGAGVLGSDLIKAEIGPGLVLGAVLGSYGLGSFFGVVPAVKASRLHPVEALRK